MSDAEGEADAIDVAKAFRNTVAELQRNPGRYRWFGIYWWPMKAMLKHAGYGPDQLHILGPYEDTVVAALVPEDTVQGTLRAALEEYGRNARMPHPDGRVETPDGELVTILDGDAA